MYRQEIKRLEELLKSIIAKNIKTMMKEKCLTQLQISEMSGIPKSTISDYINKRTLISEKNLEKLSTGLKVDVGEIDPSYKK